MINENPLLLLEIETDFYEGKQRLLCGHSTPVKIYKSNSAGTYAIVTFFYPYQ